MHRYKSNQVGRLLSIWVFWFTALTSFIPAAFANPIIMYSGSCFATTGTEFAFCQPQSGSTSNVPLAGAASTNLYIPDDFYRGSADGTASYAFGAEYGHLGLGVSASAASNATTHGEPTGMEAYAIADIGYFDVITPYSPTLAIGTPVSINYQVPIHFIINGIIDGDKYIQHAFNVDWLLGSEQGNYSGNGYAGIAETSNTFSGIFTAYIGGQTSVSESLRAIVIALAGATYADGEFHSSFASINANFMNTVQLFLEAEYPNVTLFSASGHDYSPIISSVPEPETYALMLAGLVLVGFMTHRRKNKEG